MSAADRGKHHPVRPGSLDACRTTRRRTGERQHARPTPGLGGHGRGTGARRGGRARRRRRRCGRSGSTSVTPTPSRPAAALQAGQERDLPRAGELGGSTEDPTTRRASGPRRRRTSSASARSPTPTLTSVPVTGPAARAPAEPLRAGQRLLHADRAAASRSTSSRPTSAATSSTTPSGGSWSPAASGRASRAPDDGLADRPLPGAAATPSRTTTGRLHLDGASAFRPTRATRLRDLPRVPDRRHRPSARRASRRSRRCAATSTRTPTAWPSSSSAATRTAAGRGTSTARRTPSSTAPTTPPPAGTAACWSRCSPGEPHHDPVGWPTFKDWPAPSSLTHEGTYYRWLERSWRGGQRIFVNLLVENNQLCRLYPIKHNSCDDMDSIRLQAQDMYDLQDYVDAQFGGPGRGFYRIVTEPVGGPRGHQRREDGGGDGHRDQRAVRLHVQGAARRRRAGLQHRGHRPPARRGRGAGRAADGAGQQVRQRAVRHRRRQRRGRRRGEHRELPRDRHLLGHGALRAGDPRRARPQPARRHPTSPPASRTRCSARSPSSSARATCRRCRSTRRPTTATAAVSPRSASTRSSSSRSGTCSSTPTT